MNRKISLATIKRKLKFGDIPGWVAQKAMSPPYRQQLIDEGKVNVHKPKVAAVMILIYEEDGILKIPLIHRNSYPGVHSNQVGFPGGRVEEGDENLAATALRETYEEIGAHPEQIDVLGELSELYIPPSNFLVYPYVGIYCDGKPDFVPCEEEVQEIITLDLYNFVYNSRIVNHKLIFREKEVNVPAFELDNGMIVWGATAMMLNEFSSFVKKSLPLR